MMGCCARPYCVHVGCSRTDTWLAVYEHFNLDNFLAMVTKPRDGLSRCTPMAPAPRKGRATQDCVGGGRGVEMATCSQLLKVTLCRGLSSASGLCVWGVKYPKANLLCLFFLHLGKFPIAVRDGQKPRAFALRLIREKNTLITPIRGRRSGRPCVQGMVIWDTSSQKTP